MLIIDDLITSSCMIDDKQNFPARNFVTSIIFNPNSINVAGLRVGRFSWIRVKQQRKNADFNQVSGNAGTCEYDYEFMCE